MRSAVVAVILAFATAVEAEQALSLDVLSRAGGRQLQPFDVLTSAPVVSLPFNPIDVEFSGSLDAIVGVSVSPNRLNIFRLGTGTHSTVDLAAVPTCVSVSPNGLHAAVGHNGSVTYVDLVNATVANTFPISTNVGDVVLGGNGYIYAFAATGSSSTLECIETATGTVTPANASVYRGSRAKLHPGGTAIYFADNGLAPADIERLNVSGGVATGERESPYHGDYAMCGNLWISEDGARIFTRCANTFHSSSIQSQDMIYAGRLGAEELLRWVDHSVEGGSIALLPEFYPWSPGPRGDNEVHYYTPDFLTYRGKVVLPVFTPSYAPARGRWIFFNAAGTKQYVVVQADAGYGLTNDHGVVTLDCSNAAVQANPAVITIGPAATTAQVNMVGTPGCGWKASTTTPWINTLSSGVSDGTVTFTATANPGVTARYGTITAGNATITVTQAGLTPTAVVATATSPTSITVNWSSSAVDHFEVWRNSGSGYSIVATPTASSFVDTVSSGSGHVYMVRAVLSDGAASAFGTPDYAHTFPLTDPGLGPGSPLRAVHVTELRSAVNALRAVAGAGAVSFTDASLVGVAAKAVHMNELSQAVNGLRAALSMPSLSLPAVASGSVIEASTTLALRASIQ